MGVTFLRGEPIIQDIRKWCLHKGRQDRVRPVMACVFFNTDDDALDFVRIKAQVARQAGVGYWVYELPVDSTSSEVKAQIQQLNENHRIHGILLQRPLPSHLDEVKVMGSIDPWKHIEEYSSGVQDNIAADSLTRFLSKHDFHCKAHLSTIHIAGFGNIITEGFSAQMRQHYQHVVESRGLPLENASLFRSSSTTDDEKPTANCEDANLRRPIVLVSELHCGPGAITSDSIAPQVKVIIDLGNYVTERGVVGDVDQSVFKMDGLAVAPTPGGMLPVLLWVMMERTIKAKLELTKQGLGGCFCQ